MRTECSSKIRAARSKIAASRKFQVRRRALLQILIGVSFAAFGTRTVHAQTSFTSNSVTTAWNASRWNNTTDAAPYTSAFTANNAVTFTSGSYTFAGMGATTNVGNVTVANGVTVSFASIGSTYATGGVVRTIDVGTGGLFDLNSNAVSTAAGTGLIKTGAGVFGTGGGAYTGGFTLNAGTVVARGTTGLGSGVTNVLTLNGGTIASNATRTFDNTRFGGGIVFGGNVQFGEVSTNVSLVSSSADLSFANNVSLGTANRTLTVGNSGTQTFSGIISNTGTGGLTFGATAGGTGRFDITNAANTFTGPININGGEVRFTSNGSLGNSANTVTVDGGRLAIVSGGAVDLSSRSIFLGSTDGTSISAAGTAGILTYNGVLQDKTGSTGILVKQGQGILSLGGVSTYTGNTAINNGTVQLTTGNDRLPTGTVVSLGQSASANLGTLDLNGFNQTIAGLNSTTGTNATASNNTVTSTNAATLTLGGSGTYSYGDGSNANSGIIAGSISLVKSGTGTQTLGDINTYTGGTMISGGTLVLGNATNTLADTGAVNVNGGILSIGANSDTVGAVTLTSGSITGTSGVLTGTGSNFNVQSGSVSAILGGTVGLDKSSAGTVTLSGANIYTGTTNVTAGTLVVNGNNSAATGAVSVSSGATLAGTGTIGGATTIAGIHNPGNSPGIQTFSSDLTYSGGASVNWELIGNTTTNTANPGATFDSIVVGGNLNFAGSTLLNLNFASNGSNVLWADSFWDTSKSGTNGWLVYNATGSTTNFGNFQLNAINWTDSAGNALNTARSGASFGLAQSGNGIYLNYSISAVPEPSSVMLLSSSVAAFAFFLRRRKRNNT